jgi:hypothetical protein
MNSNFLNGFADEITKEASHPLFKALKKGGTNLGRKVKGMVNRATKGKKPRLKKQANMARLTDSAPVAKMSKGPVVAGPKASKIAPKKETDFGFGGTKKTPSSNVTVGKATALGSGGLMASSKKSLGHTSDKAKVKKLGDKLMAPSFGSGGGFGGNQAPAFTADDKDGKIGNPKENPGNFGKKAGLFNDYKKTGKFNMAKDYKQSGKGTGVVQADAAQREWKNNGGYGQGQGRGAFAGSPAGAKKGPATGRSLGSSPRPPKAPPFPSAPRTPLASD